MNKAIAISRVLSLEKMWKTCEKFFKLVKNLIKLVKNLLKKTCEKC